MFGLLCASRVAWKRFAGGVGHRSIGSYCYCVLLCQVWACGGAHLCGFQIRSSMVLGCLHWRVCARKYGLRLRMPACCLLAAWVWTWSDWLSSSPVCLRASMGLPGVVCECVNLNTEAAGSVHWLAQDLLLSVCLLCLCNKKIVILGEQISVCASIMLGIDELYIVVFMLCQFCDILYN